MIFCLDRMRENEVLSKHVVTWIEVLLEKIIYIVSFVINHYFWKLESFRANIYTNKIF